MEQMKILMVCLGNICRSPLAQGILESKVNPSKCFVDSAGTAAYHTGNAPDPRSIAVAKQNGIDIQNQKARQFRKEDFQTFTCIYVMDTNNYRDVIALASDEKEKGKVQLILESGEDVPDPYYGGKEGFQTCFELLEEACNSIIRNLDHAANGF